MVSVGQPSSHLWSSANTHADCHGLGSVKDGDVKDEIDGFMLGFYKFHEVELDLLKLG